MLSLANHYDLSINTNLLCFLIFKFPHEFFQSHVTSHYNTRNIYTIMPSASTQLYRSLAAATAGCVPLTGSAVVLLLVALVANIRLLPTVFRIQFVMLEVIEL